MAENNPKKSDAALREEKILKFWRENKIFEKSLEQTKKGKEFIFYEGPPTANGKPGIHHLEARAFKDAIPRYKTMRGYHVRRKSGWDTHGLPVEIQVEKKLGLNSKKAIEEYGIAKFNQECKENVWEYVDLWKKFTERIGFWLDQEHPYITYDNNYIESVWNILSEVDKQKLIYKDYKVVPWCPRCGTVLSSHELAQGYEVVKDLSVYAKFRVNSVGANFSKVLGLGPDHSKNFTDKIYILAWTTTPWTLPGNVALAVGNNIDYVKVEIGNEFLILAKTRLSIIAEPYRIVEELKGKDLVGLEYEPLYPFLKDLLPESEKQKLEKTFKVYSADFVNTEDGTGIVHTAVMYGQDDFELGSKIGLPKYHLVNSEGRFIKGAGFLEGRFVKDEEVAVDIIKDLAHRGLLFKKEKYEHSYPHCWRCHTALIYYARDSWYIRMSDAKIKKKLIAENKKINWEPAHIREGRFGEWLREVKDWAISRERYWGTPLPFWITGDGEKIVVDSFETLKKYTKQSGNKYFVMRHGEAGHNAGGLISDDPLELNHLTPKGEEQIRERISFFKKEKIDLIVSSPYVRTRETAEIVRAGLGLISKQVIFDDRLGEFIAGDVGGNTWSKFMEKVPKVPESFTQKLPGGESMQEAKNRMATALFELEEKYKNKNILIVSHGGPTWLLRSGSLGQKPDEALEFIKDRPTYSYIEPGGVDQLDFVPYPHNADYELDFHRPYIDEIVLKKNGKEFRRVKEVLDVWFDSGSMPFAQDHYPFDFAKGKPFQNKKLLYPADFISEAVDQTRGWFYTLHAIGVLMKRGLAYKNVICLGHLLDANGKKMSKSVGNVVDPWIMIEKYGVDTLRLWMYSVNQPGESKNFDEKTVLELHRQFFGLLYNVLAFYELYRDKSLEKNYPTLRPPLIKGRVGEGSNILDQWILAKLNELVELTTKNLDNYKLLEPTRAIKDFINDLSTWYLRRSRERIKDNDTEAKKTLYFVLKSLAKILAPFAPFTAEDIWQKLRNAKDASSVHLAEWPKTAKINTKIIAEMQKIREIVSLGLEARQKVGIQVRQPLAQLEIKNFNLGKEYLELIKDEINVKEVKQNKNLEGEVSLDIKITAELKQEGNYRELVRAIQDFRKKKGLTPSESISLIIQTTDIGKKFVQNFGKKLKKAVIAEKVLFAENDGEEIKIDDLVFKVKIEK